MATHIEIGSTPGFRYIGISPALTGIQQEALEMAGFAGEPVPPADNLRLAASAADAPYHEVGYNVSDEEGDPDARMRTIAHAVAKAIKSTGEPVTVDEVVHRIPPGENLFPTEWEDD